MLVTSATAQESVCAECHEVEGDPILASPHADLECGDCHAGFDDELHPEELVAPACSDCHEAGDELAESSHQDARPDGSSIACEDCHGAVHELVYADDPASPVHPARLAETCGGCHSDPAMAERFRLRSVLPVEAYRASVHGRSVVQDGEGATCTDCHGAHRITPSSDPDSPVHRARVPETCGDCHAEVAEVFAGSVHGEAAAKGIEESPVCTDCHGEHRILAPADRSSPVFVSNIPKMTCGRCHNDLRLTEKFGLDPNKVPAYSDSYHGLAGRAGAVTVAHCGSCHGIHDILPSADPASHIHPDNLAETCGECHPGAGTVFAIGPVHILSTESEHTAVFWIRRIYLWLIALTIGGMVLHNGADFYRKARRRPRHPGNVPKARRQRLSPAFRFAHGLFAGSFVLLVYTGFALKYPEAWWAAPLDGWQGELRGLLHRIAAVVMVGAALFHVVHLAVSREARRWLTWMRPAREDLVELKERVAWLVGRRETPPVSPWVGYPEKIEYLAVVWGTLLMGVTGVLLWAETFTLRFLPSWVIDVATVIHLYEAILASLAILVWHFYFVIFDPVVYPMDMAWWNGLSAPGRAKERRPPEG